MPTKRQLANAARSYLRTAYPDVLDHGWPLVGQELADAISETAWAPVALEDKAIYVMICYALVCLHADDERTLTALKDNITTWRPRGHDAARLFVQALHKPIDAWQDKPQQATNYYSRYAGAVRHLVDKGEVPSAALASSGTVNKWEQLRAASRRAVVSKPLAVDTPSAEIRIKHRGQKHYWTSNDKVLIASLMKSLNRRATKSNQTKS